MVSINKDWEIYGTIKSLQNENTHITKFKRDFKIFYELFCKLWIHFKDIKKVIAMNLMKVTVSQGTHIAARFTNCFMLTDVLTKYIIFT